VARAGHCDVVVSIDLGRQVDRQVLRLARRRQEQMGLVEFEHLGRPGAGWWTATIAGRRASCASP